MSGYRLTLESPSPGGLFRYGATLCREDGSRVDHEPCSTQWGARWWAKRRARRDLRARRSLTFEIRP